MVFSATFNNVSVISWQWWNQVPECTCELFLSILIIKGQQWSWSHGSWINHYLWNQCISPLMLWFRTPVRRSRGVLDTTLCDEFCQWLEAVGSFFRVLLSSPPILSGFRDTRSLVFCVWYEDRCLSFSRFSFGHCVVCFSSIYGFWLLLWYLQTLL